MPRLVRVTPSLHVLCYPAQASRNKVSARVPQRPRSAGGRHLTFRTPIRLLDVESQLKVAEPRLTMLEDYEKRLAKLTESLLLWYAHSLVLYLMRRMSNE